MNLPLLPTTGWIQVGYLFLILFLLVKPVGLYIARVLSGEKVFLSTLIEPVEKTIYRLCGIDAQEQMTAHRYTASLFVFSFLCFAGLFWITVTQEFPIIDPSLAFNMAASFLTGTNWQAYNAESTVINFTQQYGFTLNNFMAAATGMTVMAVMARAFGLSSPSDRLGNFWVDLNRSVLYVLLPLSFIVAIFLVSQGVVQSFNDYIETKSVETGQIQTLSVGPVASQVAIKQLGTNGGGFYTANAAHPFENPTPLSNFIQILALLIIPASLTISFGKMAGSLQHGYALLACMFLFLLPSMIAIAAIEYGGYSALREMPLDLALGNMEGKELRFGVTGSTLMTGAAAATSGGSLNSSIDSYLPLSGAVPLVLILLGEVVFGGVGTGLCGMVVYALFTVFLAGLMVGRSPEYLGRKIDAFDIKMISLIILIPVFCSLGGASLAMMNEQARLAASNPGSQGFTQILYAFASSTNGNGSSFGGLLASTKFYNVSLGLCMLLGRFGILAALIALSGNFAKKSVMASGFGKLETDSPLFVLLMVFVILTSAMAYVPSLALGPLAEHLHLTAGGVP